jgi:outer membrane protein insertion porin family
VRSSFNFSRKILSAELSSPLAPATRLLTRYELGTTGIFDEQLRPDEELLIDRLFPQVRLSKLSSTLVYDRRDDSFDPSSGGWASLDASAAIRAIGSQVGFAKTYMQGYLYRRVPGAASVIVAAGARLGLATGFPNEVLQTDPDGDPVIGPDGRPLVTTVREVPASERFFAGGDTTVRGFAFDQLGTPETLDAAGFPKGGNGLILLNAELRVPVWQWLRGVVFLDAGNVFARASELSLGELETSTGFGVRVQSPVGPIRFDVGFRLPLGIARRQFHISIGQAF